MALGALIIKARLSLTDEELVEQIKENPNRAFSPARFPGASCRYRQA
jgi:hypothetical protein